MLRRWVVSTVTILAVLGAWSVLRAQRPFKEYPGREYRDFPVPPDWNRPSEWTRARLRVPGIYGGFRGRDSNWTTDYPRSDRHLLQGIRRLSRIDTRSVEQVVDLDGTDDVYNWPWLCAGEMGDWKLTDAQAQRLREYLLRGGFLMLDDFWGTPEWERFVESMQRVFPDRPIVEIESRDAIFHTVYDLDERYQVPGDWALRRGSTYRNDGSVAHWRGIYDDKGRVMVAISFNSDIGDSWEWADDPRYPEKYSALGIRIGINYVVYAMTH